MCTFAVFLLQHAQYMSPDPVPHGVPTFPMQSPPPPGYPRPTPYPTGAETTMMTGANHSLPPATTAAHGSSQPPVPGDRCE